MKPMRYVCLLALAWPAVAQPWQDPSPHVVHFVNVEKGVRLEVLDWGGAGRPVVLLAGSGNSAHVFDDFAPKLKQTGCCHVYGITRRGFGASTHPDSGYDDQRLAEDVFAVIDALKLTRPVLVGHSLAGAELTTVGNQHSDRLAALIYLDALGDPTDFPADDPAYRELYQKLPAPMRTPPAPPSAEESRSFSGYRAWQMRTHQAVFPESELRNGYETNPDGTKGKYKTPRSVFDAIFAGRKKRDYSKIRVPVLALLADPAQEYQPTNAAERKAIEAFNTATAIYGERWKRNLQSGVPGARFVDVPGAGHYLFLTNEADVLREVGSFVLGLGQGTALPHRSYSLLMVAVVPSTLVRLMENFSLYVFARSRKTLSATASPSWMEVSVSLRQWMPEWMPWPKLILWASLCRSPFTVIILASEPVYGMSVPPSLDGACGFAIAKLPSKKNFSTVMQAPATVPCPVG
jgi:pimeloyl-ACP methyl ester carboxylesterase